MSVMKTLAASTATIALALTGCATIPDSSAPISQGEAQQGAEAHPQLLAEFGGAMTGPQAQYVEMVGQNIAVQSGLANARGSFTVSLLNSPVNNAFAIPGGYVYTTRQLVSLMNNEAELAGVLGHEVGHVAARHSQRRQQAAQRNSILGVLGAIASQALLGGTGLGQQLGQLSLQGSQLLTLKFSRSQELEADRLGIQYLNQAGYDTRAMATVLSSLAAQNSLDAQLMGRDNARLPEWASTHPDPASRVQTALNFAQEVGGTGRVTNRDTFLTRIDGILYGDDPQQGVVEGRQFIHPDLRLAFTAPQGFYMVNGTRAVTISGQSGKAQFSLGPYNGNLQSYVTSVFGALSDQQQVRPASIQTTTVNGLPAAYGTARVNSGNQNLDVTVFAYEFSNDRAYHFLALTPAGQSGTFNSMFSSMRRITAQQAANVIPRHVDVVTVGSRDTVATMAARMAYDSGQEARFRVLNGLSSTDRLQAGQKVKIVVRGR
ncbi:M48 family metalloprotease [Erythrobacter aquimaris]|uniref:M48 family metalloprotease n=1 Tax=Qipengyuania aquimaris TaxID=255984 RepID=A0A6I4TLC9_9SPHN|nr:M48 family metalloprotease [Qipengyuania aquimaris]MXO95990.1 M48 family metalloprotease [Qipengyuania aquimaris]